MDYYTNVAVSGNKILLRGVKEGRKFKKKLDYRPSLFVPAKPEDNSQFRSITGKKLTERFPGTIKECREFVDKYSGISNFEVYGNTRYEYNFIAETFEEDINWDLDHLTIAGIDIEVGSENGYTTADLVEEEIQAITYKTNHGKFIAFGCHDFDNEDPEVEYIKCDNEIDMIFKFLDVWTSDYPDVVTGWNVKLFDIVYLYNRIKKVIGEGTANRLSPWGICYYSHVEFMKRKQTSVEIVGVAVLDYLQLFQKFAKGGASQESYKLDNIAYVILGEKKLDYSEHGSLHRLYVDNFPKFMRYNIRDVKIIDLLEAKLKLIELALTIAYNAHVNFQDVFQQVRMWTILIYNHLRKKNICLPPKKNHSFIEYVGAYVKDPVPGRYKWVVSFDLTSLYPHLIMGNNISPDMFIEPEDYSDNLKAVLNQGVSIETLFNRQVDTSLLDTEHVGLTPNGQFFRTDKRGFLGELMDDMYRKRKVYKDKMISSKKQLEGETDPIKRSELDKAISRFSNLESSVKVCLNSAYGALGNRYFILYDPRQAEAITTTGQLSIRWVAKALNTHLNKIMKTEGVDYIIASDTDSVYITLDNLVKMRFPDETDKNKIVDFIDKVCKEILQPFIVKSYEDLKDYLHSYEQKMEMKREVIADSGIWVAKKNYLINVWDEEGVRLSKPKIKITGLAVKKTSFPELCRKKMMEAVKLIVNGTEADVIEYINEFKKEFKTLNIYDVAMPTGINGVVKYGIKESKERSALSLLTDIEPEEVVYEEGTTFHIKGALVFNDLLEKNGLVKKYEKIKDGDKIKLVCLKEPNPFGVKVLAFLTVLPKELDIERYIDYNAQFNKSFLDPIKIILNVLNWRAEKGSSLKNIISKREKA